MEQVESTEVADAEAQALSRSWVAWDNYYKEASRRRRAMGGDRKLREDKRKRRFRERIGIALSAAFVGALTLVFYYLLN
jgi:hypothetical protein